jgi:formylglycine-generating enzyme required for sulfatase activity
MHHGSQVSRGDLLRSLQLCPTPSAQRLAAPLLGFILPTKLPPQQLAKPTGPNTEPTDEVVPVIPQPATDKPAPELFYVLQTRQKYATLESLTSDLPAAFLGVQALQDDELQPWAPGAPLPHQPILPAPRLSEFLRQTLAHSIGRQLDVSKLVKQVARLKMLSQLPRKPRVLPAGRVVVLLDLNKRLRPFWQDAQQLCETIERKHGRSGLDIRVLDDNPLGEYWNWFDESRQLRPWQPLHAQSVVFIVSDLGQLASADNKLGLHWLVLLRQCHRQGINPVVLAPISAAQQDEALQNNARQLLWHKHSRLQPQRRDADHEAHRQAVRRVLGLLSVAAHVEPELLRAILACLPARQANSGIEAAVWLHDDVNWGYTAITLRPEKRAEYQALFKQEPPELQQQVLALLKAQHIGQFPAVWAEEVLNAQPLVNFALSELADVPQAEQFMLRLTRRYHDSQGDTGLRQYARRHLQRLGADSKRQNPDYASALYGLAYKPEIRQGAEIPLEYDATIVQKVTGETITAQRYYVLQQGEQLLITAQHSSLNGLQTGIVLAEFVAGLDNLSVTIQGEACARQLPLPLNNNTLRIPLTGDAITIDTGLETLLVMPILRPSWAHEIAQMPEGLKAYFTFAGHGFSLTWQEGTGGMLDPTESGCWLADVSNAQFGSNDRYSGFGVVGFDDYGLYADLILGSVQQRFRWLEPGTFLMGSPENEPEREWNGIEEGKGSETRHQVTLSQGFWLADTTVNQSFWQAVMNGNPSKFQDNPNNPVEQVSWDDAQFFIEKLNNLFPGLQAMLPSEVQWEYACRAGTDTPFSFGTNITPDQVNYNGDYPYIDDENGLFREQTVPLNSSPPNPWGLYEMHGNVWEWCADVWQQHLSAEQATDPLNTVSEGDSTRVVRGGSWLSHGRNVRSARRYRHAPDFRHNYLGFRLALGHAELKPGQSGGTTKPELATGEGTGRRVAEQRQTGPSPVADNDLKSNVVNRFKKLFVKGDKKKK